MLSGFTKTLTLAAAVISAAVFVMACNGTVSRENVNAAFLWQQQRLSLYRDSVYPALCGKIKTGHMITRLGTDVTSEMLRHLNLKDQSFSHCGIASIEGDSIFVYHALGGEFNPDQKLRRESLFSYCHPSENKAVGVFEMTMQIHSAAALLNLAIETFDRQIPFDMEFDYTTDDRLYCAEFVAKCYSRALGDSSWISFSTIKNFNYVAVDDLFTSKSMKKIVGVVY